MFCLDSISLNGTILFLNSYTIFFESLKLSNQLKMVKVKKVENSKGGPGGGGGVMMLGDAMTPF
jgi:hypothetical protein